MFFLFYSKSYLQAQEFSVTCDTINCKSEFVPKIFIIKTTFDDDEFFTNPILLQVKNKKFHGSLVLQRPTFVYIANTLLLAIPNKKVNGYLTNYGDEFIINDTNNINRLFRDINDSINKLISPYSRSTSFKKFLILFDSVNQYINKMISYFASSYSQKRYSIDIKTVAALNQYCKARLAWFSVLPILLKGEYNEWLTNLIENNFKNINENYWLQVQAGRIFLRTYFTKIVLEKYNHDLQKSLASSPLFHSKLVTNYLTFNYFKNCLSNDSTLKKLTVIKKEFAKFEKENKFNVAEQKTLNKLKAALFMSGSNIVSLFSKQALVNYKGEALSVNQKNNLLLNKGNIILDYWASWCGPCITTIKKLKTDEITYKGEKYKIIFISTDKKQQDWLNKIFPVFNSGNSFRLTDLTSYSFYKSFQITAIPRLFLIKDGVIINQNFEKEKL